MAHCSGRGDELFVGDIAHITIWEQGGVAQVILFYYIISVTLLLFILLNRTSLTRENIFQNLKRNFVSTRSLVISRITGHSVNLDLNIEQCYNTHYNKTLASFEFLLNQK